MPAMTDPPQPIVKRHHVVLRCHRRRDDESPIIPVAVEIDGKPIKFTRLTFVSDATSVTEISVTFLPADFVIEDV